MRIIFMGTPEFAVPTLVALADAGHEIAAAYTQPPRRAGRGKKLQPSPVQAEAERRNVPVRCPASLKDEKARADFLALDADVAVVAAYGLILPKAILEAPKHGCLNVHASLLPKWRGAAPIQRAILAGDHVTGITIMQMEAGLDTGPMLTSARIPIEQKTAGELTQELAELGAQLMIDALPRLGEIRPTPQDDKRATYAPKLDKTEARVDFSKPALLIEREVRAFAPFPGSWFDLDGERIKILEARVIAMDGVPGTVLDEKLTVACGNAAVRPTRIQRAGKPAMDTEAFLRGRSVDAGTLLP